MELATVTERHMRMRMQLMVALAWIGLQLRRSRRDFVCVGLILVMEEDLCPLIIMDASGVASHCRHLRVDEVSIAVRHEVHVHLGAAEL